MAISIASIISIVINLTISKHYTIYYNIDFTIIYTNNIDFTRLQTLNNQNILCFRGSSHGLKIILFYTHSLSATKDLITNPLASGQRSVNMFSSNATL